MDHCVTQLHLQTVAQTEPFKVSDLISTFSNFNERATSLLPPQPITSIHGSDLRLKTEEHHLADLKPIINPTPHVPNALHPQYRTSEERAYTIHAYADAVSQVKDMLHQQKSAAAASLKTLSTLPPVDDSRDTHSVKIRNRELQRIKILKKEAATHTREQSAFVGNHQRQQNHDDNNNPDQQPASSTTRPSPFIHSKTSNNVLDNDLVLKIELRVPTAPHLVAQEYLVLASQPLTALRDAIICVTDKNLQALIQESSNQVRSTNSTEERRREEESVLGMASDFERIQASAYFYIEGVFYNDTRSPGSIDYSEPLRRHAAEHGIKAPPHPPPGSRDRDTTFLTTSFSTAPMQHTTFGDLYLRLAGSNISSSSSSSSSSSGDSTSALQQYVYCHSGGCEHLLIFKDIRKFDQQVDPPFVSHYPFQSGPAGHRMPRKECEVCGTKVATRVTYNDVMADHTPYFWCDGCYRELHGREARIPEAYPYRGEHVLVGGG